MAERGAPLGNLNAKRGLTYRRAFEKYAQEHPEDVDSLVVWLYRVAKGEFACEIEERMSAVDLIFTRTDGKAAQAITVDGDGNGGPVKFAEIVLRAVDAANDRPAAQD